MQLMVTDVVSIIKNVKSIDQSSSVCRQRDGSEGNQCSQGALEQHGGPASGGAGGLQGTAAGHHCSNIP